jgi:rhodanese-related sulfurtransferase
MKSVPGVILRSLLLAVIAGLVGFIFNLARPQGLELVAAEPYEIYVPCPLTTKEAAPAGLDELCEDLSCLFLIDARPRADYQEGHIPGAVSIPYDPIRQLDENKLAELRKVKGMGILVYGDLEINSGKLLADELASAGLRGVRFLQGGFPAWIEAGRGIQSGGEP